MRAFRHQPPELDAAALVRPRLLEQLLVRFDRRVVAVMAPAGYGKSTLLAQAVAENALAPRGYDVWLACEPADADGDHLAASVLARLGVTASAPGPNAVAEALWQRAPLPVALVLEDRQRPGSPSVTVA